jgi:hypothetical protein
VSGYFTHKRIRIFIEQIDEESFAFHFRLNGQEMRGTIRTRMLVMAKKRAQMFLDRKLRELHRAKAADSEE